MLYKSKPSERPSCTLLSHPIVSDNTLHTSQSIRTEIISIGASHKSSGDFWGEVLKIYIITTHSLENKLKLRNRRKLKFS